MEEVIPDADVTPHLDQMKKADLNLLSVQKRSWNSFSAGWLENI